MLHFFLRWWVINPTSVKQKLGHVIGSIWIIHICVYNIKDRKLVWVDKTPYYTGFNHEKLFDRMQDSQSYIIFLV